MTDSWGIVNLHVTLSFATIILKNKIMRNREQIKLSKDVRHELLEIILSGIQKVKPLRPWTHKADTAQLETLTLS